MIVCMWNKDHKTIYASGLNEPRLVPPSPHSSTAVRMKSCSQQNKWFIQMERVVDFKNFCAKNLTSTVASRQKVAMNKLNHQEFAADSRLW